jgi:threonine/homoserine/homoserine lactone efflux protein
MSRGWLLVLFWASASYLVWFSIYTHNRRNRVRKDQEADVAKLRQEIKELWVELRDRK